MPVHKLKALLSDRLNEMKRKGGVKGNEMIVEGVKPPGNGYGPRFKIRGYEGKEFLRMNSNSYLGLSLQQELIEAEEHAARNFGAGPGAVRFISGTYQAHKVLERRLAEFHGREDSIIFSSAYAAMLGTLASLIDTETVVISDELNHNCIINGIRLSRPKVKEVYRHLDLKNLTAKIEQNIGMGKRLLIITDGIFSMRGDFAPLDQLAEITKKYDDKFEEGAILVVDDSHGVGAFGKTGRGTEEYTGSNGVDILIATLGKAFGVNGGYVAANSEIISYLRETAPTYIYSNPITVSEATAALRSIEILESEKGRKLLENLKHLTGKFETGLINLGYEVIQSEHPVVPLMIRDTKVTSDLVSFLIENGILATGLNFPVVPKGDEEIRFQINADHTDKDIEYALKVIEMFKAEK